MKYQLFRMPSAEPVCSGLADRIGQPTATIRHKLLNGEEKQAEQTLSLPDHETALLEVLRLLTDGTYGAISHADEIEVVGHRVVHGGERFHQATLITRAVKEEIQKLFSLAPLHNPPSYTGIVVAEKVFTKARQVAIFDTAFHQTMPEHAFRYAIPRSLYEQQNIRVYGFHGTSHKYVSRQAMKYLDNPDAALISIHLGSGCSITAVKAGRSVDTSMGFGPLSGLVMGTRSGDIDPSVVFYLVNELGYEAAAVSELLNKKSGMLGMTGCSDMRDVGRLVREGDQEAELACQIYAYRIRKYIGAYAAVLNRLDAIIFTAGVGENDKAMRERICHNLDYLNIALDAEKNRSHQGGIGDIGRDDSPVKILVIPTNEELEIARQCFGLLSADEAGGESL